MCLCEKGDSLYSVPKRKLLNTARDAILSSRGKGASGPRKGQKSTSPTIGFYELTFCLEMGTQAS